MMIPVRRLLLLPALQLLTVSLLLLLSLAHVHHGVDHGGHGGHGGDREHESDGSGVPPCGRETIP